MSGPATTCAGNSISPNFVVTDPQAKNTWYKFEISDNGGASFYDLTTGEQATFSADNTYSLTFPIDDVIAEMHGVIYRLVVSTFYAGLNNPDCIYFRLQISDWCGLCGFTC